MPFVGKVTTVCAAIQPLDLCVIRNCLYYPFGIKTCFGNEVAVAALGDSYSERQGQCPIDIPHCFPLKQSTILLKVIN